MIRIIASRKAACTVHGYLISKPDGVPSLIRPGSFNLLFSKRTIWFRFQLFVQLADPMNIKFFKQLKELVPSSRAKS